MMQIMRLNKYLGEASEYNPANHEKAEQAPEKSGGSQWWNQPQLFLPITDNSINQQGDKPGDETKQTPIGMKNDHSFHV